MTLPRAETHGRDAGRIAPIKSSVSHGTTPSHVVQFYENDQYLTAAVGQFLAEGLSARQPVVVIATGTHREAFAARLNVRGYEVDRAIRDGRLIVLDAQETLDRFMRDGMPDAERFRATVGGVMERIARPRRHSVIRAYGEMVDVLWKEGNTEGAIQLEDLWNELALAYDFSLLCAYAMGNFYKSSHAGQFQRICEKHQHVVPTEHYIEADEAARLAEISLLQQRARALETEIEHRHELEQRLREALALRRRAEEALRHTEQELRQAAIDRENLLMRERRARSDAEAASHAKSEFLAVMSHELRTPLNAIAGHVQLIQMGLHGPVTPAQSEALERVVRNQRHLLSLINDVLNLARIEAGRVEYRKEDVPIAPLLADVHSMLEPLLSAHGLRCDVHLKCETEIVARADREKVRQILLNLLTNAIKFTEPGGRITLSARCGAGSETGVHISVADTGIGIEQSKLQTVFEPFVQLQTGLTSRHEGAGLGLAISRDLARGMGGNIIADSEIGVGTTFTVSLPAA